jgi:hypothetical protein
MPYNGDPRNNPIDAIRLNTGDVWDDMEYLTDADYEYYLVRNKGSESRTTLDAMRAILFKLSRGARERAGDIEVYGSEYFDNYLKALTLFLKNPDFTLALAVPYAGGISKADMYLNDANPDSTTRSIYIGFHTHQKLYNQTNPDPQQLEGYSGLDPYSYGYGGFGGFYR